MFLQLLAQPPDDTLDLPLRGRVFPVLGLQCTTHALQTELCKMVLFTFRIGTTATKVRLQVVENSLIPWDNHSTHQAQESPVLHIDSTVWIYTTRDSSSYLTSRFCASQRMHLCKGVCMCVCLWLADEPGCSVVCLISCRQNSLQMASFSRHFCITICTRVIMSSGSISSNPLPPEGGMPKRLYYG